LEDSLYASGSGEPIPCSAAQPGGRGQENACPRPPLIGFAFDGYPVYGPYEAKGVLAKDAKDNPLNEYNLHGDEARGPHYHVTPGKFPHIVGGDRGQADPKNRPARKGPPKK
jgi:hypothetical protein